MRVSALSQPLDKGTAVQATSGEVGVMGHTSFLQPWASFKYLTVRVLIYFYLNRP